MHSLICNLNAFPRTLGDSSMRLRLGSKVAETDQARNRKNQPVWIESIQLRRDSEDELIFELLEEDKVVAKGRLRLAALAMNSRYISKKVDLEHGSQLLGRLFVDLGLESLEKDRLPALSQHGRPRQSASRRRYWKS